VGVEVAATVAATAGIDASSFSNMLA